MPDQTQSPGTVPVVLCGGAGTRLWPMSREEFPKQLLPLAGERTMLQDTLGHFAGSDRFRPPLVVTNQSLRFAVAEQMRQIGLEGRVVLEPMARNTAPAIAASALILAETAPSALMLVVPSDHVIRDEPAFLEMVAAAEKAARAGHLVTFAIVPDRPETGYGYIQRGDPLRGHDGVFRVRAFVEKPDAERATRYLAGGEHFWNSGMFLFQAATILAEFERLAPAILAAARRAVAERNTDLDFIRLGTEGFAAAPAISIDYAIMEKTGNAVAVPCSVGWSDVGSWSELWELGEKDSQGNVLIGDAMAEEARGCYVRAEKDLVAVVGVEDLVVVATEDAVLVTSRRSAQEVKRLVERLRRENRPEAVTHSKVYRPWGSYQSVDQGERFQVKRLIINPGARISLQKHFHRAEHWVVVSGTAMVTRDGAVEMVRENESIFISSGTVHRLENPGRIPLHVIEVQSGSYLGEDDIVRFEDVYGRV